LRSKIGPLERRDCIGLALVADIVLFCNTTRITEARNMTISVRLDEATATALRRLLDEQGGSLSAFVRAAILEKLDREGKKPTPYELGKHLFGRDLSGPGDLALNHKKYFREEMRAKHRR